MKKISTEDTKNNKSHQYAMSTKIKRMQDNKNGTKEV
jgi:hypothetical protein